MRRAQLIGLVGIVVASGLWATPAVGQEMEDGNQLLRECRYFVTEDVATISNFGSAMRCGGLVKGVWQTGQVYSTLTGGNLCTPDGATTSQMIRVVVKFLEENPERLHRPEVFLVTMALADAFPCSP